MATTSKKQDPQAMPKDTTATTASASAAPRYSLGIDLGTTHCALSWVDTHASDGETLVQGLLDVPQLTSPGSVQGQPLLPSFIYLPHASQLATADLALPWASDQDFAVGEFARARGAATPIRLVQSAKSWLGHTGVDRRGAILPAEAPPEVARISPVEASVRYLAASLGPQGIRANAVSAGPIKTLAASGIGNFGKLLAYNEKISPLRRNVTILEVGNVAAFLLSDLASGVTGEVTYVDAGFSQTAVGVVE